MISFDRFLIAQLISKAVPSNLSVSSIFVEEIYGLESISGTGIQSYWQTIDQQESSTKACIAHQQTIRASTKRRSSVSWEAGKARQTA